MYSLKSHLIFSEPPHNDHPSSLSDNSLEIGHFSAISAGNRLPTQQAPLPGVFRSREIKLYQRQTWCNCSRHFIEFRELSKYGDLCKFTFHSAQAIHSGYGFPTVGIGWLLEPRFLFLTFFFSSHGACAFIAGLGNSLKGMARSENWATRTWCLFWGVFDFFFLL